MTGAELSEANFTIDGKTMPAPALGPGLHLVPTPIGNLRDITIRALATLAAADRIYCEDTRVTRKLTTHFSIKAPLSIYNDHNGAKIRPKIIKQIQDGRSIALVSDAGMPLIADPGYKLVQAAWKQNLPVTALPGPSSVPTALAVSGLPSDRFLFAGFVPPRNQARVQLFNELARVPATLIFFEAARRLARTLEELPDFFADREIVVARELTKRHEQVVRGTPGEIVSSLGRAGRIRGECVILISPGGDTPSFEGADIDRLLDMLLADHSTRDAANLAAKYFQLPRRDLYARALERPAVASK